MQTKPWPLSSTVCQYAPCESDDGTHSPYGHVLNSRLGLFILHGQKHTILCLKHIVGLLHTHYLVQYLRQNSSCSVNKSKRPFTFSLYSTCDVGKAILHRRVWCRCISRMRYFIELLLLNEESTSSQHMCVSPTCVGTKKSTSSACNTSTTLDTGVRAWCKQGRKNAV